ncbi:MAG: Flp pilus assembly protein CpaB [Firmicutes bacterium]|nr:Flp pilus assembly protein CpaB [Bacillota bacterium]
MFRKRPKLSSGAVSSVPEVRKSSRETSSWFLLGALACAIAAGLAVTAFLRAAVPSEKVYVLKNDLQPGAVITPGDLEEKSVPASAVPADRARSAHDVNGKHARSFLLKGDILREGHLAEVSGSTVSAALLVEGNPNLRAVALPPESSKGLGVAPGDSVDVYAYVTANGAPSDQGALIVSSARVVAVSGGKDTEGQQDKGITVAVPKDAAARITAVIGMNGKLLVAATPPQAN